MRNNEYEQCNFAFKECSERQPNENVVIFNLIFFLKPSIHEH